jgi:hypothetical protein
MKYPKKIQNGACIVGLNTIANCQWFNGTYSGGNIPVDFVSNEFFFYSQDFNLGLGRGEYSIREKKRFYNLICPKYL